MNDVNDYCPHAVLELFLFALEDKRKPTGSDYLKNLMKRNSEWRKSKGIHGMNLA